LASAQEETLARLRALRATLSFAGGAGATKAIATRHAFPEDKHLVPIADADFEAFMKGLEKL
jgi:hypothetical protein